MHSTFRHPDWQDVVTSLRRADAIVPLTRYDGTPDDDVLTGTQKADEFHLEQGGDDIASGARGNDSFYFGAAFTGDDRVNGGSKANTVYLDGDYSAGLEIRTRTLVGIESLNLAGGSYVITGDLGYDDRSGWTRVRGEDLTAGQSLDLNVSTKGRLYAFGGAGDDIIHAPINGVDGSGLLGGAGDDVLIGGSGASFMQGQEGADRIVMSNAGDIALYNNAGESVSGAYDTIENFRGSGGKIKMALDSDTTTAGTQHDFHFRTTRDHVGDIVFTYDAQADETIVTAFTDHDAIPDFILHLAGNEELTKADFLFI